MVDRSFGEGRGRKSSEWLRKPQTASICSAGEMVSCGGPRVVQNGREGQDGPIFVRGHSLGSQRRLRRPGLTLGHSEYCTLISCGHAPELLKPPAHCSATGHHCVSQGPKGPWARKGPSCPEGRILGNTMVPGTQPAVQLEASSACVVPWSNASCVSLSAVFRRGCLKTAKRAAHDP